MGEELYMYLSMSDYVVSAILFWQSPEDGQRPISYMSKALVDAKTHYSQVEQMTLSLCIVVKKFRLYFQAHQVTILTNQPLRITIHKLDLSEWIMKLAIKWSEYGIQYKPHLSLKCQVLTDFIVELP